MTSKQDSDITHLSEMAAFFPVEQRAKRVVRVAAVPMQPGETAEEAEQRHAERTARIRQQIADRK